MNWTRDKKLHLLVGAAIAVTVGYGLTLAGLPLLVSAAIGLIVAAIAGWVKEYAYDKKRPERHTVDKNDFYATALGGAAGAIVLVVLDFLVKGPL